jgi:hypothetical protein
MWRAVAFVVMVPISIGVEWGVYLGAKLALAALGISGVDQIVMAVIAVVLVPVIGWAAMAAE